MEFSQNTNEIFKAMANFRTNLKQPEKSAKNPFFKSNYVPLEGVVSAIDKAIENTGLSYIQNTMSEGQEVSVQTVILHESGEYIICDPLSMPASKAEAQQFGSALTYCRRYSLASAFGVCSDFDDDANDCSGDNAPKKASKSHIQTAKLKISQLADKQDISPQDAEQMILKHFKVKGKLENVTAEQITLILNYLKSVENK
ncbi:single-stranded DNA-binding protein [Enterococcus faecium]|uniref:ERF family protein n=1 Tax=Enterococcus faecium TaxID=1352 RepID=UPI000CF0D68C|nr:ERF family protein [Enterococcus faecium]PQC93489.1 single-stranded DNA-binding protein [Enterococcus faecium]